MNKKSYLEELPELQDLKQFRENLGLSQSELSRRTGISQQTISRIESGKNDPSYSKIKKIVEFLNYFQMLNFLEDKKN